MNRRVFLTTSSATVAAIAGTMVPLPAKATLDYEPDRAGGLRPIRRQFGLSGAQQRLLQENGFAILGNHHYPSFTHALADVYSNDLPLYISADTLMHAVHRSFTDLLRRVEADAYQPHLTRMLSAMRGELAAGVLEGLSAASLADVDLYLAVALSLLSGELAEPIAGADPGQIQSLFAAAQAAKGMQTVTLFGAPRNIDASQFTPRGHYTQNPVLTRYFKAMIWLGRIDFRFLVPDDKAMKFQRRDFDAAVGLRLLMDQPTHELWLVLEKGIGAFVGPQDSMTPIQLDDLMAELSVDGPAALVALSDSQIQKALEGMEAGKQQILSHLMMENPDLPLSRTFLLLGQRYTFDSHVFSAVVYDRLAAKRLMPDPLDVAYAALGNDSARPLLTAQLQQWGYGETLDSMRALVDENDDWGGNLYNAWLRCLRALSAPPEAAPSVTKTEAWGRRMLSCQLASWAELRRDTVLYAKQSFTAMLGCDYPDVFVDPYPAFYDALRDYADLAAELATQHAPRMSGPQRALASAAATLGQMARQQEAGEPFTDDQMDFINTAVSLEPRGSGGQVGAAGWYTELFYGDMRSVDYEPVIADVHTQPTDRAGNIVGHVLHVAAGVPRQMVVTVDTCRGPRAYVGPVAAYHEITTRDFKRLTDQDWAQQAQDAEEVPWMAPLVP